MPNRRRKRNAASKKNNQTKPSSQTNGQHGSSDEQKAVTAKVETKPKNKLTGGTTEGVIENKENLPNPEHKKVLADSHEKEQVSGSEPEHTSTKSTEEPTSSTPTACNSSSDSMNNPDQHEDSMINPDQHEVTTPNTQENEAVDTEDVARRTDPSEKEEQDENEQADIQQLDLAEEQPEAEQKSQDTLILTEKKESEQGSEAIQEAITSQIPQEATHPVMQATETIKTASAAIQDQKATSNHMPSASETHDKESRSDILQASQSPSPTPNSSTSHSPNSINNTSLQTPKQVPLTPTKSTSTECLSPSQFFGSEIGQLVDHDKIKLTNELQHATYVTLKEARQTLETFNEYSESSYKVLVKDITHKTRLVKDLKRDLDYMFKRINNIRQQVDTLQKTIQTE